MVAMRLKLGFVLWNGQIGGAERHTVALANSIERLGLADTHVIFVGRSQPVLDAMARDGYRVEASELGLGRGRTLAVQPRRAVDLLQRLGVDALFVPVVGFGSAGLRMAGFTGALIGVEHGDMMNVDGVSWIRRRVHAATLPVLAPSFDGFVAVSDVMARRARDVLGAQVFMATVPNGVDTARYVPRERGGDRPVLRIGVAARLVRGKGVREAILAMSPRIAGRAVSLRVAGDGPMRGELERLARERGVQESVEFLGTVEDMPAFWQSCDLAMHVTNGFTESFCLAVAEAQASGIPVIASRSGALPSIVADGETGAIVEPGDIRAARLAITEYAANEQLRTCHGASARARALRLFSLERAAHGYVEVACDVLARRFGHTLATQC